MNRNPSSKSARRCTIAITGLDAKENPYPGLSLARCLRDAGGFEGRIIGLTYDILCTGMYRKDVLDAVYMVPYPSLDEALILGRLEAIHEQDPIDVLLPALDTEIATFARLRPQLNEMGIRLLIPSETKIKNRSKTSLYFWGQQHNVKSPRTKAINDIKQIAHSCQTFSFPVAVKGSIVEAHIARSVKEAEVYYKHILAKWGYPVLLQEYISGEEIDVAMLLDEDSQVIGALPIKKFGITAQGKAFSGVIVDNPELMEWACEVAQKLQWVGPMELEIAKDHHSGEFNLLEVNARFPAWIYLSVGSRMNLPWAAVRLAMGEEVTPFKKPEPGALYFRNNVSSVFSYDIIGELMTRGKHEYVK